MKIENIYSIQKDIHLNAVDKGFWEKDKVNRGEMGMLIVSELSESLEADRSNKWTIKKDSENMTALLSRNTVDEVYAYDMFFIDKIKNKVEDEIADTTIRILDFTAGWKEPLIEREYRKESTGNFGHDLLRIVHYVLCAFHEDPAKDWGYCIAAIEKFCDWYSIDINSHIAWKMGYNKRRPYKHGKKY
jgi:hypothetical protein